MITLDHWKSHPGRNPLHRFGAGRDRGRQKIVDPRTKLEHEITLLGPKNPNRWLPHQGERGVARRLRRAAQ